MRFDDALRKEWNELRSGRVEAQSRGRRFERLVADLFDDAHFDVTVDAGVARPRQTDIFAAAADERYLIEAKWRQSRADVGDVASLYDRLRRTPPGVVGVLISMAGFTASAVDEAERSRDRPMLLVDGSEIEASLEHRVSLRRLLREKHRRLVSEARATPGPSSARHVARRSAQAPPHFADGDRQAMEWLMAAGGFGTCTFTLDLVDIDWVTAGGAGVVLDFSLEVETREELLDRLGTLVDTGWLSPHPTWSIQQSERTWHGVSRDSLMSAVAERERRYLGAGPLHHTEELVVADSCPGGWYTLKARLAAGGDRVYVAELSLQLVGVPLDRRPLERLLTRISPTSDELYFRPRTDRSVESYHVYPAIPVTPLGWVVDPDVQTKDEGPWARGIVVDNPFQSEPPGDNLPAQLHDVSVIVADLSSWHPLSEPRAGYALYRLEWAWSSDAMVLRATADW